MKEIRHNVESLSLGENESTKRFVKLNKEP